MNTLPPLPLNADGSLSIDHSGWIEHMMGCSRHLQYLSLAKRRSARESAAPSFGQAVHKALELRYRMMRDGDALPGLLWWEKVGEMLRGHFAAHPAGEDFRNETWATAVLQRYHERYPTEHWKVEHVEVPFERPLYTHHASYLWEQHKHGLANVEIPVKYMGRIDLGVVTHDGLRMVVDHKTTSRLGKEFWDRMRMSSQLRGYCWAAEQVFGQKIHGYVVNAIRVKEPPSWENKRTRATEDKWWEESLARERFLLQDGELEAWRTNTIELCERFFEQYARGSMPMATDKCTQWGRCQFYDVCEMRESDRDEMLASGLYTDNKWSPLTVTEAAE